MKTDNEINLLFCSLIADREQAIASILEADQSLRRIDAAVQYDCEQAPISTNWKMLEMLGIDPNSAPLADIIVGLARWNIFLNGTDHLTDEEVDSFLKTRILLDEIRMLPPNDDMYEFITINTLPGSVENYNANRDATLPKPPLRESIAD
jgi:hypothetical protein